MLDKTYTKQLKKHLHDYAVVRRDVIKVSGDALHHAKRAIFSMHRDNLKEAKEKITQAEKLLSGLVKKYKKHPMMQDEGSYKAALEEYVEAYLMYAFFTKKKLGKVSKLNISAEVYLAGLCDVPGELYRYAVRAATSKDVDTVNLCAKTANEIVGELIEFDLTKYLRTKFDQAKHVVRKIEHVVYELSLRN